jgi:adenylate cyclase
VTEQRVQRRLAAILAADVVGYSALMERAEEATYAEFERLKRELIEPCLSRHEGRLIKTTGDGALVEFASPSAAVRCAVEVQESIASGRSSLKLRIGVNLGEVIVGADGDLFGDGINIAVRLEGIADPGGILISEKVCSEVEGKLDVGFEDRGERQLKNISKPVRAYAVCAGAHRALTEGLSVAPPLPEKPSIAVLQFQNMSGDPEQEYFADGIAEDIVTALSRIRWLFVISRNSSFVYKGRNVDVKQVGHELGVRYLLEGSVRKARARVRITGQLIEAETGVHLWAEHYDRDVADIFAVQDEITQSVAMAIGPALAQAERLRVLRKPPDSLDAWDAYHRGSWHFLKQEPIENENAKPFFQRAIDLDSDFAPGYYGLALAHMGDGWLYLSRDLRDALQAARPLAQRAVVLDDADATAHYALAFAFLMGGDLEGWRTEAERAVALDPNHAWALGILGAYHAFNGQPREAFTALNKAMRASPHDPLMWAWMLWTVVTNYFAGEDEAALQAAERLIRFRPDKFSAYRWRAAALGQLNRSQEAKKALQDAIELSPKAFYAFAEARPPWMRSSDYARQIEGLRKAGLPER